MAATSLSAKAVGSVVKLNISGAAKNFIIVNKEAKQVAVIIQDIWTTANHSTATGSSCTSFYNALDADIKPYVIGSKAFIPTKAQVEGGWSYFNSDARRVAKLNGSASSWWLADLSNGVSPYYVRSDGGVDWDYVSYGTFGVRPALYLSPELLVSDDGSVSTNTPPEITSTAGTGLGEKSEPFALGYTPSDADGDALTVTEKLDGEVQRSFPATSGTACNFEAVGDTGKFQCILNGQHELVVEVSDGKESASYAASFTKAVRQAVIQLKTPLAVEGDITVAVLAVTGKIPDDAEYKVEVTNNAKDPAPVWQDCTAETKNGSNIVFANHECVNGAAFSFRITVKEGPTREGGYISAVTGAFQ